MYVWTHSLFDMHIDQSPSPLAMADIVDISKMYHYDKKSSATERWLVETEDAWWGQSGICRQYDHNVFVKYRLEIRNLCLCSIDFNVSPSTELFQRSRSPSPTPFHLFVLFPLLQKLWQHSLLLRKHTAKSMPPWMAVAVPTLLQTAASSTVQTMTQPAQSLLSRWPDHLWWTYLC